MSRRRYRAELMNQSSKNRKVRYGDGRANCDLKKI